MFLSGQFQLVRCCLLDTGQSRVCGSGNCACSVCSLETVKLIYHVHKCAVAARSFQEFHISVTFQRAWPTMNCPLLCYLRKCVAMPHGTSRLYNLVSVFNQTSLKLIAFWGGISHCQLYCSFICLICLQPRSQALSTCEQKMGRAWYNLSREKRHGQRELNYTWANE